MNDRKLIGLLHDADDAGTLAAGVSSDRVRRVAARRLRRRRIAGTALLLILSAGLVGVYLMRGGNIDRRDEMRRIAVARPAPENPDVADVRMRIQLETQTRLDHRDVRAWVARVHPMELTDAREDAARTMVIAAPRRGELSGEGEEARLYGRAIALFPETKSANDARAALARLEVKE